MVLKKFTAAIFIALATSLYCHADEGMWIINELNKQSMERMKELGFTPDYSFLFDSSQPCLANAVVIFGGGCSGVTVSEQGLIFTNHHCGYGALQQLSSVEHDYLKNGFSSQTYEDELPVEGLSVRYLKEITDVTDSILPHLTGIDDEYRRVMTADSIGKTIINSKSNAGRFEDAALVPFFNNNKYYIVIYSVFRDVRLVFAPPTALGKFGGDTDNWMWPRHTCDFSVFRVYADNDNKPAEFDANNKPYNPRFVAGISGTGYNSGDYAMTIGFPGSTDRYLSSWGVKQRIESINKPRIEVREIKQDIWKKAMQNDDAVRIKYASKYASSSNYWKNSIGMNRGIEKLDVVSRKEVSEARFNQWAQHPENQSNYGNTLELLQKGYEASNEPRKYLTYLSEAFANGTEIIRLARIIDGIVPEDRSAVDVEDIMDDRIRPFLKDYDPQLDQQVLTAMLTIVKERVPNEFLPDVYISIDKKYKGDYKRFATDLFAKTALGSEEKIAALISSKKKKIQYEKKDPAALLAQSTVMTLMTTMQDVKDAQDGVERGERLYFEALRKLYPDSVFYSDANFTMRLSYGSIAGYQPFDAAWYNHFTTNKGLLEKEDPDSYEFALPQDVLDLVYANDFGAYANRQGELQLCFLSNNDITGGNSGSPVFDANGRVIGLAFDGNWEAMSGDIVFEPQLQRTISVDIRYVLWMIDKWGNCPRLINELKLIQ